MALIKPESHSNRTAAEVRGQQFLWEDDLGPSTKAYRKRPQTNSESWWGECSRSKGMCIPGRKETSTCAKGPEGQGGGIA